MGDLGGLLFSTLGLPLPWLLGSLCTTIVASMAEMPVEISSDLRKYLIVALGVMVGGTFSPDILTRAGDWLPTLSAVAAYLIVRNRSRSSAIVSQVFLSDASSR